MPGIFFLDSIRRTARERARQKRVRAAQSWPTAEGEINHWKIVPAGDTTDSFAQTDAIEAAFHFTLNGEYYGGYLRSVPMGHREAEKLATGSPKITLRYDPANPDHNVVLAEENKALPFAIVSG
ncbi:MAG TPA: DUF3592 domain-containing protein [Acidobacteriaceae bacterium]|nr:DUF3592 domain-containing protein [Acidobacteriaceae bacterium]